jgi:hypothetical protein
MALKCYNLFSVFNDEICKNPGQIDLRPSCADRISKFERILISLTPLCLYRRLRRYDNLSMHRVDVLISRD